ncbi:uncharacterized protein LOC144097061 [Amblyomma americanum]
MHLVTLFLSVALAIAAQGLSLPSARTFGSPHEEHMVPAHHHGVHHQSAVPDHVHSSQHEASVGGDLSGSALVCQVVQIPVIRPAGLPAGPTDVDQAAASPGLPANVASSVISSSQQALSTLNSRVRTSVDSILRPVVSALENASQWLNSTSQAQMNHHPHQQQHGHHVSAHHHPHQQPHLTMHQHQSNQHGHAAPIQSTHGMHFDGAHPQNVVPMTVISLPVLVPAVNAGSGLPFASLSNAARGFQPTDPSTAFQQSTIAEVPTITSSAPSSAEPGTRAFSRSTLPTSDGADFSGHTAATS